MRVNRDIAEIDIWRSAELLVDQHGADAPIRAAQRADELLAAGARLQPREWQESCFRRFHAREPA